MIARRTVSLASPVKSIGASASVEEQRPSRSSYLASEKSHSLFLRSQIEGLPGLTNHRGSPSPLDGNNRTRKMNNGKQSLPNNTAV